VYIKNQIIPHREHIVLPLKRTINECHMEEKMAVYCKNHIAHKNTLCGQNVECLLSKPVAHIAASKP